MRALVLIVLTACGGSSSPKPAAPAVAAVEPGRCAFETDGIEVSILAPGARAEKQALTTLVRSGIIQLSVNAKPDDQKPSMITAVRDGVERLRGAGYVILHDTTGTPPVLAQAVAQKDNLVAGSVLVDGEKLLVCSFELDAGGAWKAAVDMCSSLRAAGAAPPCTPRAS